MNCYKTEIVKSASIRLISGIEARHMPFICSNQDRLRFLAEIYIIFDPVLDTKSKLEPRKLHSSLMKSTKKTATQDLRNKNSATQDLRNENSATEFKE